MDKDPQKKLLPHRKLHLKAHLFTGIALLSLSFLGVVLTDMKSSYSEHYWDFLVLIFAASSIVLSLLGTKQTASISEAHIGREIMHWLGLIVCVYFAHMLDHLGFFSTPVTSIVVLLLLSLTTFLAGVHFDCMFIILGIFVAIVALLSVFAFQYLSFALLPIFIILLIILSIHLRHKKYDDESEL